MYRTHKERLCQYKGVVTRGKTEKRQCRNYQRPGHTHCARHQLEEQNGVFE